MILLSGGFVRTGFNTKLSLIFCVCELLLIAACVEVGAVLRWADFGYIQIDDNFYWFEALYSWWFALPVVGEKSIHSFFSCLDSESLFFLLPTVDSCSYLLHSKYLLQIYWDGTCTILYQCLLVSFYMYR